MRRLLAVVLVLCAAGAHAQSFPSRPVRIVIGFPRVVEDANIVLQ